jgi:16S rRNA (adenine(1408)-N(1))-methyltransferase
MSVLRLARQDSAALVIGIDTNASGLLEASRRASRPIRKGGLLNAVFIAADATEPLLLLHGRIAEVRLILPWGSLLRAVLDGERRFALAVAGSL